MALSMRIVHTVANRCGTTSPLNFSRGIRSYSVFCRSRMENRIGMQAQVVKRVGLPSSLHCRDMNSAAPHMEDTALSIADTPLGTPDGRELLDGLDLYTVHSNLDSHPLTVYGINSEKMHDEKAANPDGKPRRPVLLLHGRTWSAVPVYHLLGGPKNAAKGIPGRESRSLMEEMYDAGLQPYTMDFRGFGGTPHDESQCVEPNLCASDAECVLKFIADRHGLDCNHEDPTMGLLHDEMPALLGWSQGALIAQLVAQRTPHLFSKLILYGSIYDSNIQYPRTPLYLSNNGSVVVQEPVRNTFDSAVEDFTVEGTIPFETARLFAEAGLLSDPLKAQWKHVHQFNNCDPGRIHAPTLVVAGDQDPYAPLHVQAELFSNLGRGSDRTWSIISDADHAVHLLDGRHRFLKIVTNFIQNSS
jgi:pimeloyl-ACP methyl ester carboxylesterase